MYALGALAYHVLSGVRPYAGVTSVERVLAAPPAPIDEIAPDLPADLRAIVAKAMSRNPEDRYPSAKELALDLQAFATGRLVSAQSYSLWALLRRWVAHHRVPVALAVAFVTLLGITLAVSVTRIVRERDRADSARKAAVQNQQAAEKLVDYLLRQLRGKLEEIGRLDVLAGLSEEVERYYATAGADDGTTPAPAVVRRAEALGLLARVHEATGNLAAAVQHLSRAQTFYEAAVARDPNDLESRLALCGTIEHIGDIEKAGVELDEAGHRYRTATECVRTGSERYGSQPKLHRFAATVHWRWASLAEIRGKFDEARTQYLRGREELTQASRLGGDYPSDEAWLARTLAMLAWRMGALEQAVAEGERAVAAQRELARRAPGDSRRSLSFADALETLGRAEAGVGRWAGARGHFAEALALIEALVAREPGNLEWQHGLGIILGRVCEMHISLAELEEAKTACGRELAIGRRLAAEAPAQERYIGLATLAAQLSADLARAAGDLVAARRLARESHDHARRWLKVEPTNWFARHGELMAVYQDGQIALKARDGREAAKALAAPSTCLRTCRPRPRAIGSARILRSCFCAAATRRSWPGMRGRRGSTTSAPTSWPQSRRRLPPSRCRMPGSSPRATCASPSSGPIHVRTAPRPRKCWRASATNVSMPRGGSYCVHCAVADASTAGRGPRSRDYGPSDAAGSGANPAPARLQ